MKRHRVLYGGLLAIGLLLTVGWRSLEYREVWWRSSREEIARGAVYTSPKGEVLVRSEGSDGDDFNRVAPDGSIVSLNGPRIVTPWFVLPRSPAGVLVERESKAEREPGTFRKGGRWGFTDRYGHRVEITGPAPFGERGQRMVLSALEGSDLEDRAPLVGLAREALDLARVSDGAGAGDLHFEDGFRYAAVFSVLCPHNHGGSGSLHRLWIVVGDLPPLVFDSREGRIRSARDAGERYCAALDRWLRAQSGEKVAGPVPTLRERGTLTVLGASPRTVDLVRRRLRLMRNTVTPWMSDTPVPIVGSLAAG